MNPGTPPRETGGGTAAPAGAKARPRRRARVGLLPTLLPTLAGLAAQAALALLTLGVVGAAALLLVLRAGPVEVPLVAELAERAVNANEERRARVTIGGAVIELDETGRAPHLTFRDVRILAPESDEALMAVPALSARFHVPDLLDGVLSATEIEIRGPDALFVRGVDGTWRFGLGAGGLGGGLALAAPPVAAPLPTLRPALRPSGRPPEAAPEEAAEPPAADDLAADADPPPAAPDGSTAVARVLASLVGDAEPPPEIARLESIRITGATLRYRNAWTGAAWQTEDATLRVTRDADGITAAIGMRLASFDEGAPLRTARFTLRRDRGASATEIDASFRSVRPSRVASGVPELDWLALIDAPVDGILRGRITDAGAIEGFGGRLWASGGRFVGTGGEAFGASDFSAMRIVFAYDVATERLTLDDMLLAADAGEARLSGLIQLERGDGGALRSLVGQLRVGGLTVDLPEQFDAPLTFDSGEVVMRIGLDPALVDIASARLGQNDTVLDLSGRLRERAEGGWTTDLRAEGRRITIDELKTFWPLTAARNARAWVVEHLGDGMIDAVVAQLRLGRGEPQLSLDFTYRDLDARYLGDMPAIHEASGQGALRLHEFVLEMEAGHVEPIPGELVELAGSRVVISDLWGAVTPADITISGAGDLRAILKLIDQPPLSLVGKLGLDPDAAAGTAEVTAVLRFPLLADLLLEQVEADTRAGLAGVTLHLPRPEGRDLEVFSETLALTATTSEMTIAGAVVADGVPVGIDWREIYGATPSRREVVAKLRATPALLARFGVDLPAFAAGEAGLTARISQTGTAPPRFAIVADLADAELALPDIGWSKARGAAARLEAEGGLGADGTAEIKRFALDAPGLDAAGSLGISAAGGVASARLSRVRLGDRADLAIDAARVGDEGLALTVTGRLLDLAALRETIAALESEAAVETEGQGRAVVGTDLSVDFDIARVLLTPATHIEGARGTIRGNSNGRVAVDLTGSVNGTAPVGIGLVIPAEGDGSLTLKTDDAGAFLRATGLAEAARDGTMAISARLLDGRVDRFEGKADLRDVTLREARTFERILRSGGVERAVEVRSGGLGFNRVEIPFSYDDGVIDLGTSIATGPKLAVKLSGTIDEASGALDLSGVISPAYAVTGALNNIPLLGAILSGGEGEGILAMTFTVGGTVDDPSYAVNPLSLLTPGFLRRLFTSKTRTPDERFLEGLQRGN